MAAPALILFGVFAVIPLVGVVFLSLTSWDGLGTPAWVGFGNWPKAFADPLTYNALRLTLLVMVVSWIVQTPLSLLLGVFTAGHQKYRTVLSVLYFVPLLLSSAAIAIAFKALLDPTFGLGSIEGLGILAQNWLGDPVLALATVIFVIAWQFVPFHTLLFAAGVRQIPASMYEASTLDGAGRFQQFWYITLPQLKHTLITSTTLILIGSLTYFDLIFVLTQGGPGTATRVLALDMYLRGFRSYNMGVASVIAVILAVVGVGLAILLSRLSGSNRMTSQREGA
ncbi:sugar ABC transporter permease [Arthrobacter sp. Cr_A7]|uniref:carbohydrate ABC transporter permease n=1 Tax=Arthrobacter sp. Cr_A7 TaxID=3031017 RepID=UPI0023DA75C6|nr:sugar ABC transporter permease [Arthrobacter sp. Cr_A7]MDF2049703.1 sugar ABC transporter permease [Arthrobacter sp. Cr_A7]